MSTTIFTAVQLHGGAIEKMASYEVRKEAEAEVLGWAKKDGKVFSTFSELMQFQEDPNENKSRYFVQISELTALDSSLYPYKYRDECLNLYELQAALVEDGYEIYEELDELEFSQSIYDRQNGNHIDDLEPIPELLERYECSYRGGEIFEVVYAKSRSNALALVCEDCHHPEYWEI